MVIGLWIYLLTAESFPEDRIDPLLLIRNRQAKSFKNLHFPKNKGPTIVHLADPLALEVLLPGPNPIPDGRSHISTVNDPSSTKVLPKRTNHCHTKHVVNDMAAAILSCCGNDACWLSKRTVIS
jgi:hypothetical protein